MDDSEFQTADLEQWLIRIRAGDAAACDEVIRQACDRLRRLTKRMFRDFGRLHRWEQTDDVLQGALLRLHRSLIQVQPDSARRFFALAATQIQRTLIDLTRRHFGPEGAAGKHHTDGHGAAADDCNGPLLRQPSPVGEPTTLAEWSEFHKAVQALSEDEREVFGLLWYDGLSQPVAAAVLGVSLRTLKRRWQNARWSLYQALQGQPPQG